MADSQRIQPLGSPPSPAVRGTIYVDASLGLGWYDGTDWHYPIDSGGGGGAVDTVTAEDTSVVVDNTDPANPTIHTGTLDVIATDRPPAAAWSNNSKKITSVADPASAQDAATKHYVDTTTLPSTETLHGVAAANANDGDVALNSHKLTGVTDPASAQDAATKHYVDAETTRAEAEEATLLPLAGGTMSGAIAMGAHKITGLTDGSSAQDAAAFHQIPTDLLSLDIDGEPISITGLTPTEALVYTGSSWVNQKVLIAPTGGPDLGFAFLEDASGSTYFTNPGNDSIQAGFLAGGNPITATINSSTGVLTFTNYPTSQAAWFLTAGGVLMRGGTPVASPTPTVSGVTSGDFAYLALYMTTPTTPGGTAGTSLVIGTSRTTAALAAADQVGAAAQTGKTLVWDGIAHLASSTWTLVAGTPASGSSIPAATGRDRRPWAKGYRDAQNLSGTISTSSATPVVVTGMAQRVECSGATIIVSVSGSLDIGPGAQNADLWVYEDGVQITASKQELFSFLTNWAQVEVPGRCYEYELTPSAGSHLIQMFWANPAGAGSISFSAASGTPSALFRVEEDLRANANNGTA